MPVSVITVAGEALVDVVHDGAGHVREVPGGGPANVALGLGRLGADVEFATWLGPDDRGHRIAEHLAASGVRLVDGAFGAARTSSATVQLGADGQPSYVFDIEWDLPPLRRTPEWLHVGSIGAFLHPGAEAVLAAAERTTAAGGTVSFDPNIRPALLGTRDGARARFEELATRATVVKLSDEDAAWLWPTLDSEAVLDSILALGPELAVITTGASGSVLATADERVSVPGEPVEVVDTVGAGDTYTATLVRQLTGDRAQPTDGSSLGPLDRAALTVLGRTCSTAAAITVGRRGADLPTADEIHLAGAPRAER